MAPIFHITTQEAWDRAEALGVYRTETLPVEGFIHCSTRRQVVGVANLRFRGQTGLVLLVIDKQLVEAEILYENSEGDGEMFPHIYGELNTDAVIEVLEFKPNREGYFALPSYGVDE